MTEYVRQHHNLASRGKLGQKAPSMPKKGTVMNDHGPSGAPDRHKGSHKVPKHRRGQ